MAHYRVVLELDNHKFKTLARFYEDDAQKQAEVYATEMQFKLGNAGNCKGTNIRIFKGKYELSGWSWGTLIPTYIEELKSFADGLHDGHLNIANDYKKRSLRIQKQMFNYSIPEKEDY